MKKKRYWNLKLTDSDVIEIRKEYRRGNISKRELAEKYGVCAAHIGDIIKRNRRYNVD